MKKTKFALCVVLLSATLAGNIFAGGPTSTGFFGMFDSLINAVVSFALNDNCETRQCQTCRPREDGGSGNCRPTS